MKKVILMLAVAAMASCSKSEVETRPVAAGDVEIQAGSTVLSIETKAPFTDKLDANGQTLEAYVIASKSQTDYATADAVGTPGKWCEGKMTFGSGYNATASTGSVSDPVGFTTAQYYPADDTQLYMVGLVPSDNTKWTIANTSTTGVIEIDGKTDIMAAAVTTNSANANGIKKSEAIAGHHPSFTFNHLLTKLDIYVKADVNAATSFGKITKLELKDAKNQCTVTLDGAAAKVESAASAFAATSTTTCPFYRYDYSATTPDYTDDAVGSGHEIDLSDIATNHSTDGAFVAYAMVNPVWIAVSNAEKPYVLHIESEKGLTKDVEVKLLKANNTDVFENSTQGMQFKVTLTFKATDIKASATVTEWNSTDTGNSDITVE